MKNTATPKLSVLLVTYNHENYIRQAMDSVMMQQTDFDFEIVVADDCSQDSTIAVIEEYQAKNHNIRILPSERNVGITRNYQRGFGACRGEYIAVLEGDDYWISPNKLRTMAALLDKRPECVFCFHRLIRLDEGSTLSAVYPTFETTEEAATFTASQLVRENFIGNFSTCVYRREVVQRLDLALFDLKVYDWMFNISVAQHGAIGYVPEVLSVYRAHPASTWSAKTELEHEPELLELIDKYNEHLHFKFDEEFQACKVALIERTTPPPPPPQPKVSVLLVTYNQQTYVRQALESALMQKADFHFEVVVADDHSDDLTLEIVNEYEPYHHNLRVLPAEEKIGITRNYQRGFEACSGEYVAILEGDDYWISWNKLQLISRFLDEHPECSFCFHRIIRHDEVSDDASAYPQFPSTDSSNFFTAHQLATGNFIGGFSTCTYRKNTVASLDPGIWKLKVREWMFNIAVAAKGPIGYLPEIMSIYRVHEGGIWSLKAPAERTSELLDLINTYNEYLNFEFDPELQAYKDQLLLEADRLGLIEEIDAAVLPKYYRAQRWLKPFVPPVLVSLSRKIYLRTRGVA